MPRHLGTIFATTEHWQASTVGLLNSMHYFNGGCRRRKDMLRNRCIIYQPRRFLFQGVFITSFLAAAGRFFLEIDAYFWSPDGLFYKGYSLLRPWLPQAEQMCFCGWAERGQVKLPMGMASMWLPGHSQPLGLESKRKQGLKVVQGILRFQ